ncbi:aspartate/glutamate racemase family protein [Pseudobacillus sp. 179-B 2D1 NHS]|uniref:aspartate/glutamate racemase family protein n=1 Tax=Pseudobacillus sp. 179-B 2D1 NHS TaxID=3374292 RepID=UPI0038797831
MKKKILFIDPVYNDDFCDNISEYLDNVKRSDTDIEVISLGKKPGPEHLEYRCYEIMAMPDIVRMVKEAEESGYDAAIIGCFYDPALRACREVAEKMVVSAPAESSLHIASTIGESISIIVGRQKWMPEIKETIHKYGFFDKVVSIKPLGMGVLDFQKDHEQTLKRMRRAAIEAVEKDGADVIVRGCTAELGFLKNCKMN